MVSKRFHVQVIFRILLILANCICLGLVLFHPPNVYTIVFLSSLVIIQTLFLIRYVNRTNRELSRFFASLRDQDSSFSLSPEDPTGSFREIAQVINDTRSLIQDARIDKEKQYRYLQFIINHMDIGLLSFNEKGKVEHYNRTAGELLGSRELSDIKNLNSLHPEFEEILHGMEPGQSRIVTISPSNEKVQLLFRMTQLIFDEHPLKLLSLQDVRTELDEQELISWKRLIRVLNHEVMNSLTPIRTLTHAIERSLLEIEAGRADEALISDIRENSRLIEKRSTSLADFVNRYREITRIRDLVKQKVDVHSLFREVMVLFKHEISELQADSVIEVDPSGLQLKGDEEMLKQVVINLVKNSLEALLGIKNGKIILSAWKDEGQVCLCVEDNGPGIPNEYLDDIFTPFFSTREDGSGIGLSFSKHIVRMHGGTMSIWSESGIGTRVSIRIG